MVDVSAATVTIRSTLNQRTLVIGNEESIVSSFPALAEELLACENLELCGALDQETPTEHLWQRIEATGAERLWIIGGDGTINMVGECLLQHQRSLPCHLTPAGTANDLARALSERMLAATNGKPQGSASDQPLSPLTLDLLEVSLDHASKIKCCANMLTLGSSARNTQHVTDEIKARWGAFAYLTQLWRAIGDLEPFSIRLSVGQGDPRTVDGVVNLFVANGPYCGGGYRVAPPAVLDDGLMDTVIFRQGTTAELAHVGASFLAGSHLGHNLVEHFSADKLTIDCSQESPLTLDGEAFTARTIAVRVLPHYLPITLIPGL